MKTWLWIALGLLGLLGIVLVIGNRLPSPDVALEQLVEQQVEEQGILGMSMGVRLADGTTLFKSSGSTEPAQLSPWTSDTVTAIGSVTKTFTAVVIMQLVEEGRVALDRTIEGWFPDVARGNEITIRMLLSHTSGIANYISIGNVANGRWVRPRTPGELIAEGLALDRVSEPGSKDAHYSNTAYVMLGLIIERVTGNDWKDEVISRIAEPLGMADTAFLSSPGVLDGMIGGYGTMDGQQVNLLREPWYPHPTTLEAAGAMVSSVSDLMRFATALFDGQLIADESLRAMATPVGFEAASGLDFGLGGAVVHSGDLVIFGMGGDIPGFNAFLAGVLDTKLVVAAACNTLEGDLISPSLGALEYMARLAGM